MTRWPGRQASLTRRLLLWVLAALLLVWSCFVLVGYRTGIHEAGELTDGHLAGTAALLVNLSQPAFVDMASETARPLIPALKSHDYQPSLSVVVWDAGGQLLARSGEAPLPRFAAQSGFADLQLGTPAAAWRSFSQWDASHRRQVMVLVKAAERDELAADVADQLIEPGLWLLPAVALALGLAIWRGLLPLQALSRDVTALEAGQAGRLQARHPYREFNAVVGAINRLLSQQQATLARERQLASEMAHELRTPLASIALQAAALKGGLPAQAHAEALRQIGADALRAGHVVSQLLALARASRTDLQQQMQRLDLAALVRRVVADYAQAAWASGHVLSVQGEEGLQLQAHPLLLELALRNLIDNALQHTARGTSVCVQWGSAAGQAWLQVCDDGARQSAASHSALAPDRLGLGHQIIDRVMGLHGGSFAKALAPVPWNCCYRLAFAAGA
ncbi:histidine kinase [Polaromonas sp. OV174]|uniref:histidine kinase dimerization/phospho-acceptor domain-containing protein n=1 Tax=Polaromonas sp. OV174 TaxID=1855300 RepID=UPI0008E15929|nr:histidine kinase dimerization/phospho-acceptor domain-containing protein [Polaromonas sp. OV174]SFC30469.1 histidine kinase [Polaromonas sp. OV174]